MEKHEDKKRSFDFLEAFHAANPINYVDAKGAEYVTEDGNTIIDMNEMMVVLGQKNEPFIKVIEKALRGMTSQNGNQCAKETLLEYLDKTTSRKFLAAHLTSSGSEAVEAAVRVAQKTTGRSEVISFWNSIHGRTFLSSSMSGVAKRKAGYGPLAGGTVFFPYPYCARCPFQEKKESCGFQCLEMAKQIYRDASAQDVAALIVEPCQGNGIVLPPPGYLKKLELWAKEKGILFIVDEIQCGMGRSGEMYMYEKEGLDPDILLLGKALGNGFHIAAMLTKYVPSKENLMVFAGGSGDEALACAAACEVFRQLEDGLLEHNAKMGRIFKKGFEEIEMSPLVKECRCAGLFDAIEFYSPLVCERVHCELFKQGFHLGRMQNVLFCKAPYTIQEQHVEALVVAIKGILMNPNVQKCLFEI